MITSHRVSTKLTHLADLSFPPINVMQEDIQMTFHYVIRLLSLDQFQWMEATHKDSLSSQLKILTNPSCDVTRHTVCLHDHRQVAAPDRSRPSHCSKSVCSKCQVLCYWHFWYITLRALKAAVECSVVVQTSCLAAHQMDSFVLMAGEQTDSKLTLTWEFQ